MITVIIPAYNCRNTITATLASVFDGNADIVNEVIVVDDGSSDGTDTLLADYAARTSNVRIVTHPSNRGGSAARNTATAAAQTELVFCLDSDNILPPASLRPLYDFAIQSGADVVSFRELHFFVTATSAITHKWRFRPGVISLCDYLAGGVSPGASGNYLYRRSAWEEAGGYPESAGALDAWGFGLRLVAKGKTMNVMPSGHYFHRYGHESYWVRDRRTNNTSAVARQILAPFESQLHREAITFMNEHPNDWFEWLSKRPLRTRDGRIGTSGEVVRRPGLTSLIAFLRRFKEH